MFTQFFGSYLLNNGLVTSNQLNTALELQSKVHVKLGVLAINAGYLTAEQVDDLHRIQATRDIRIGDLAVELGYMTPAQVSELLAAQKPGYLSLGQALVDSGVMTNGQFQIALESYKKSTRLTENEFADEKVAAARQVIKDFYHLDGAPKADLYADYVSLLLKNIIRFIGDDFTLLPAEAASDCLVTQELAIQLVCGDTTLFTALEAPEKAFIAFASRYAQDEFFENDEYVEASVGEFLNQHNGLFAVNASNSIALELDLEPQQVASGKTLCGFANGYIVPIGFPFGTVRFLFSPQTPVLR